jgi:NADPH2:quinone reductase
MIAFGSMRAVIVREFGGPDVLRVEDAPALTPASSQVLVTIRAAGVNPVDAYMRNGTYAQKPTLPYTPGSDGAGDVAAIGAAVTTFKPGDRVYIANDNTGTPRTGTYAEQALCAPTQLHPLPAKVSFGQGAALGVPYATAYRALFMRPCSSREHTV